ncbi:MAG: LPS export ABC transporter permease LptF [Thiotrichales bacterium]|jgi:lipopolysaccharide export system permease protein|nr:LPS export ABC transporter permease LptF [Thiotrichales bacterium]MBT3612781.1 LPS export ABC transporter permease LptF [Thiotrichales bacterium]MBT3753157.1 LPS export ABC transporter permease LptF [Thiotrichales bacterium]MBT4151850.1 LPS export ABC transporter permease LptF [Thiotrichales bacterium]MBT4262001.1 LPS export ABC transporter permease LptF [Thiotrichales bacterium]
MATSQIGSIKFRFTTLESYLVGQVLWTWLVATPILIILLLTLRISKMMAQAASGQVPAEYIWQLIWLKVPAYMGMVIPMTIFFSVLIAFGRLYQESEVTAFRAGGVDIYRAARGVRWLSVVIATVVTVFVLYVTPWAQAEINNIHDEINANENLVGIAQGQFKPISGGSERVFYAEEVSTDQRDMSGVFFYENMVDGGFRVITSKRGELDATPDQGGKWLVLKDGRQYSGTPGKADIEIVNFSEYGIKLNFAKSISGEPQGRAIPVATLWGSNSNKHQAELHWRFSLPIMTILLVFLAIPLSRTTPRGGKYAGVAPGILIYLLFSNLFNIAYGWVEHGEASGLLAMGSIYVAIALLIFVLYLRDGVLLLPRLRR